MEFSGYLEVRTVSLVHITYVENFGGRGEGEREREREREEREWSSFLFIIIIIILDAMKIKESREK